MIRKRRQDRNHAIYCITNIITGEQYVGITVISTTAKQALKIRIRKHVQRAHAEDKPWTLCEAIRTYGNEAFVYGLLEVVRGRKVAHARERELIRQYSPALNTF